MGLRCRRYGHARGVHDAAYASANSVVVAAVRLDALPEAGETYPIVTKGALLGSPSSLRTPFYLAYRRSSSGDLELYGAFVDTGGTVRESAKALTLEVGRWYFLAASIAGLATKSIQLYHSAREHGTMLGAVAWSSFASTATGAAPYTSGTAALRVGADVDADGAVWQELIGSVAHVQVWAWGTSLDAQALTVMLRGDEAGLVGYWRLDDSAGGRRPAVAYDRARGRGNNLELVDNPNWTDAPEDLAYPGSAIIPVAENSGAKDSSPIVVLGYNSVADRPSTIITATSEAARRSAQELSCPRVGAYWQSVGLAEQSILFDAGVPVTCGAFSERGHNYTSAALIEIGCGDTIDADDVVEVVTVYPGQLDHVMRRPYQYRYWRRTVLDSDNPAGFLRSGRVDFWAVWEPAGAGLLGSDARLRDPSTAVETVHRDRVGREQARSVDQSLRLPPLLRAEQMRLRDLARFAGGGGPVWVCADVQRALHEAVYGYMTELPGDGLLDPEWLRLEPGAMGFTEDGPTP